MNLSRLSSVLALSLVAACTPDPIASLPAARHDRGGVTFDFDAISAERFSSTANQGPDIFNGTEPWKGVYTNSTPWRLFALPHGRGGKFRIFCRTKARQTIPGDCAFMTRFGTANPYFRETPNRNKFSWCAITRRDDKWYPAMDTFEVRPGETHFHIGLLAKNSRVEVKDLTIREIFPEKDAAPLELHTQFVDSLDGIFELSEGQVGSLAFNWMKTDKKDYKNKFLTLTVSLPPGVEFVGTTCAPNRDVSRTTGPNGETIVSFKPSRVWTFPSRAPWWESQYLLIADAGFSKLSSCELSSCRVVEPSGQPSTLNPQPSTLNSKTRKLNDSLLISGLYDDGTCKIAFSAKPIRLTCGPAIHAPAPQSYMNGAFCMGAFNFADPEPAARYTAFITGAGCRWIIPSAASSYPLDALRTNGIVRITPYSGSWCFNAYQLGDGNVPPDERFVARDMPHGYPLPPPSRLMCPLAVAAETPYVRKAFTKIFNENLAGCDGLWANWEPFMFANRGCCCSRCRKAFADYIRKPESEIAAAWPTNFFKGGVYEKEGVAFRSICHGKLVATVDRYVRAATAGSKSPVGFIPGVHFGQLTANWPEKTPMPEALVKDYIPGVTWVNFWGPYICWRRDKPYLYEPGAPLSHFLCAKDIRETADRTFPASIRPKLMAAPEGTCGWLHQPEDFERDFDAYFFNRYEACLPWTFPVGCDARYWRAFANATARAARYESYVWQGTRCDASVALAPVSEYAARVPEPLARIPHHRNVSPLLHAAYEKDGSRIVAVFNSWPTGEAFFKLSSCELSSCRVVDSSNQPSTSQPSTLNPQPSTLNSKTRKPENFYILSDDNVLWVKDREHPTWSADDLAAGIFLSVGAARCRVFEFIPDGSWLVGADVLGRPQSSTLNPQLPTSLMTRAAVEAAYAERKPALAAAAAADAALCKSCSRGVTRDD